MKEDKRIKEGGDKLRGRDYDEEIVRAKNARNSSLNDSNIMVTEEGFLGMDDIDKLRRRHIR
jgi:hypothetical protein